MAPSADVIPITLLGEIAIACREAELQIGRATCCQGNYSKAITEGSKPGSRLLQWRAVQWCDSYHILGRYGVG